MGFFSTPKPRVTEEEYKKFRGDLAVNGMNEKRRNKVDQLFSGDMYETVTDSEPRGIKLDELESRLEWLKENKSKHDFTDKEIDLIERMMRKYL